METVEDTEIMSSVWKKFENWKQVSWNLHSPVLLLTVQKDNHIYTCI